MKKTLVLAAALGFVVLMALPAHATNHWPTRWGIQAINVYPSNTTGWTQNQKDAVADSINKWNNAAGFGDPVLQWWPSLPKSWDGCLQTNVNVVIEKVAPGWLNGARGDTAICDGQGTTNIFHAWMRVETGIGSDDPYWGSDSPEPNNTMGMRGVITHEFGHVLGFSGHWDSDHPSWCDQSAGSPSWHTMCNGPWKSDSGDPRENISYTLHADDRDSFDNAY